MAERFGSQIHPTGGLRFGSQTYAAVNAVTGDMAATEPSPDIFAAEAQPNVRGTWDIVESGPDILAVNGTSSLVHTLHAIEDPTPDSFHAAGAVSQGISYRFGSSAHPSGGLRFGSQYWAALGPLAVMAATESGADTFVGAGMHPDSLYTFQVYDVRASYINYGIESLGSEIVGTLEDGYKVMLPITGSGISFTWELNEFGNPSLRIANLTGVTVFSNIPWYVWDGSAWTIGYFSISDEISGAAFLVESADNFSATGGSGIAGTFAATETGADFVGVAGSVLVSGGLSATEASADTFAATGTPQYIGSMGAIEPTRDTATISGAVLVSGSVAATEASVDVLAATGVLAHVGTLDATESATDTFAAAGRLVSTGSMAATETATADTLAGSGVVPVAGSASIIDSGSDVFAALGAGDRVGALAAIEAGADVLAAAGLVEITGSLNVIDAADRFAASAVRETTGDLAATEGASDRFVSRGINGDLPPVADFDSEELAVSNTPKFKVTSRRAIA